MRTKSGIPPLPGAKTHPVPPHLEPPEQELWAQLTGTHSFDEPASLALLRSALEAHQRARRCREAVDRDGEVIKDRFEQIKPHPLLAPERDARAAFLAGMRALNLDLAGAEQ